MSFDSAAHLQSHSNPSSTETSLLLRTYGSTYGSGAGTVVPQEERITYSWSDINVFSSDVISSKRGPLKWISKYRSTSSSKKHILKNGE